MKTYSGGMRRRLDIAASIVVTPDLLFLDEPTTGLDPRSRNQVWDIVRALVGSGTTVLLTTQYLDEADQLADRIAVIDHGRVIAEGTSGELSRRSAPVRCGSGSARLSSGRRPNWCSPRRSACRSRWSPTRSRCSARVADPERVAAALAELTRAGLAVTDFSLGQPSLDEVFLALTGHLAQDESTEEVPA